MAIKNVGATDSGVRALAGVVLLGISASFNDRPLLALGFGLIALVLIGTALVRVCPLYTIFGVNTCPRDARPTGT
jgi:Protein of unknown function (DUF2892)